MSLSKLESLPNEILSDILEKYINGIDILMGFNYQLNRRFTGLIDQSQRLRFNFIECHKDEFRVCLGLLPAYLEKIEELAISDYDTPGQIHAFLSAFSSFAVFKHLRRLYFHFNGVTTSCHLIEAALDSLSDTMIDTLSIKITDLKDRNSMNRILLSIFSLKSVKRLSIRCDVVVFDWSNLGPISSNIEHLTISGLGCGFEHLQYIFQYARRLKYLAVRTVSNRSPYAYKREKQRGTNIVPMFKLRTFILSFKRIDPTEFDELKVCLQAMPVLNRLEIYAYNQFINAESWEMLFKTSLPLLTYFTLRTTTNSLATIPRQDIATFQDSFWKSKKNFNLIITEDIPHTLSTYQQCRLPYPGQHEFDLPIHRCRTAPDRTANDNYMIMNPIARFRLCNVTDISVRNYYFDNIKYVEVDHINAALLKWFTMFVNCSHITEVVIANTVEQNDALISFLASVTNMKSLSIPFDLLTGTKDIFHGNVNRVKRLDISSSGSRFDEGDINLISELFPHLEHIKINTSNLQNVPLLKIYLRSLRSLNFKIQIYRPTLYDDYSERQWDLELRRQTRFLLHIYDDSVTVWIDQAALKDPYWRTYADDSSPVITASASTTVASRNSTATKRK